MIRKTTSRRSGRRGTGRGKHGDYNDDGRDTPPVSEVPYSDSSTPLNTTQERVVVASEVPPSNPSNADGGTHSRITPPASEVLHSNSSTPHDVVQESFVAAFEVPHLGSSTPHGTGNSKSVHPALDVLLDAAQYGGVTTSEKSNLNSFRGRGRGRGSRVVTVGPTMQQSNSSTPLEVPLGATQDEVVTTSEVPDSNPSSTHGRVRSQITPPTYEMPHSSHGGDHSWPTHPVSEVPCSNSSASLDGIIDRVVAASEMPHSGPSTCFDVKHEKDVRGSLQVLPSSSCVFPDLNQERVIEATAVQEIGSVSPLDGILKRAVAVDSSDGFGLSKIHPDGDGFAPNPSGVAHYIGKIIQANFNGPWPTWKKVPMNVRDTWFEEFKKRFCWLPEHDRQIRVNFENKGRIRVKECFCDARKNPNIRPCWLSPPVWDSLLEYWGSDEFKAKSARAKKNRASVDGSHTGGSIPASEHKRRLEAKLGREVTTAELFMHLHQRKDKSWVGKKSSKAYEKFSRKWKEILGNQNSSELEAEDPRTYAPISKLDMHINENGKRGRIYDLESEGTKYKAPSHKAETTTSFSESSDLHYMLSKMQEELNKQRQEKEELARRITILEQDKIEKDRAIIRMQRQNDEAIAFMMKQNRKAEKQMNKKFEAMMYMFQSSRGDVSDDSSSDSE